MTFHHPHSHICTSHKVKYNPHMIAPRRYPPLLLPRLVSELGEGSWATVAERLNQLFPPGSGHGSGDEGMMQAGPGYRTPLECCDRWSLHVAPAGRKEVGTGGEEVART